MENLNVWCAWCGDTFDYGCESKSIGVVVKHEAECPHCKRVVLFDVGYKPTAYNEKVKDSEQP
jgi:hypothetical protein